MSLRIPTRLSPARSLYVAVFLVMAGILTLSFVIFREISLQLERQHFDVVYNRLDHLQLEESVRILNTAGRSELAEYLANLDHISSSRHYLLDANGNDVLTGTNRSYLLPPKPQTLWRVRINGHSYAAQLSADRQYWFAAEGVVGKYWMLAYMPHYLLLAGAAAVLCWLASFAVIAPVHNIAATIARFGQGDFSVRVKTKRQDEIGRLANSFNQMADQMQRLIVTERQLLADVSHELRSPLARLKFATRLARTSPDTQSALDRIDRDVDRITSLVAGIVEVASAEGDFDDHQMESICVGTLLDEVLHDCAVEAEMHHCKLALLSRPESAVFGNRELLRRAVENVLRNAVRYSPEGGTIDITATVDAHCVKIIVRDHGPGVPEDLLLRIFDPFFRGEEAQNSAAEGSGLGLSIARRAVLLHNGTITAKNASPGLCVEISIPQAAAK